LVGMARSPREAQRGTPGIKALSPVDSLRNPFMAWNHSFLPKECGSVVEVKLIPAICPRCGASLNLPEGSQHLYCMYCGTRIFVGRVDVDKRIECNVCDGYGRVEICRACNGTGKCTWSTRSAGHRNNDILAIGFSSFCDDGVCSACHGSGRYNLGGCPGCHGTGQCPRCLGTGKCLACKGIGSLPSPNGYERCRTCEGTGLIDPGIHNRPGEPKDAVLEKCPECGKELLDEHSVCPFCGRVRRKCPQCDRPWTYGATSCDKCGFGKAPDKNSDAEGK